MSYSKAKRTLKMFIPSIKAAQRLTRTIGPWNSTTFRSRTRAHTNVSFIIKGPKDWFPCITWALTYQCLVCSQWHIQIPGLLRWDCNEQRNVAGGGGGFVGGTCREKAGNSHFWEIHLKGMQGLVIGNWKSFVLFIVCFWRISKNLLWVQTRANWTKLMCLRENHG